jgi:multisubunit Na+/H+ antiporter MnhG subunit
LLAVLVSVPIVAFPLALAYLVWRRVSVLGRVSRRLTLLMVVLSALACAAAAYVERVVLAWTGLSIEVSKTGAGGALLAMFGLVAPLEEALKVLVVWPLYRSRRIDGVRLGLCYAAAAGGGFAATRTALALFAAHGAWAVVGRCLLAAPAQLFFAGVWGYALGSRQHRARWFSLAWFGSTLAHGLYQHIVWGRGAGLLLMLLPLCAFMAFGAWVALRDVAPEPDRFSLLPEPPSLQKMREALRPADQRLMVRWIAIGAFVTLGLILLLVSLTVVLGNRVGIDFSLADESDMRASAPLILLGMAVLLAFPLAGYLIARASSAHSVLEPALSSGLALSALIAILLTTAPIGVLFALAIAPLAFGLACGGAWIGIER